MKRFALAGNPNSGKTTLFNSLTGSTAHVGNWPGVTVDKKRDCTKSAKRSFRSSIYPVFIRFHLTHRKKSSVETIF